MLKGVVGLVTGGASGLGRATVERLVREGARVTLLDLASSQGSQVESALDRQRCVFVSGDVTSETDINHALHVTKEKFGRLDLTVNCAGISCAFQVYNYNKSTAHKLQSFIDVQMVNTVGCFNVSRLSAGMMGTNEPDESGQRGVIINTSSLTAFDGQIGQTAYAASKGAVASMTLPMARDLASVGIRVVCIAPGLFDTPLVQFLPEKVQQFLARATPFPSRLGRPDEYAKLVLHLYSNKIINGETIRLDGALRLQL